MFLHYALCSGRLCLECAARGVQTRQYAAAEEDTIRAFASGFSWEFDKETLEVL